MPVWSTALQPAWFGRRSTRCGGGVAMRGCSRARQTAGAAQGRQRMHATCSAPCSGAQACRTRLRCPCVREETCGSAAAGTGSARVGSAALGLPGRLRCYELDANTSTTLDGHRDTVRALWHTLRRHAASRAAVSIGIALAVPQYPEVPHSAHSGRAQVLDVSCDSANQHACSISAGKSHDRIDYFCAHSTDAEY
jgi:hypothetical protein